MDVFRGTTNPLICVDLHEKDRQVFDQVFISPC